MKLRKLILGLLVAALLSIATAPAFAGSITLVTADENGHGNVNGTPLSFSVTADPGPGGLSSVLTYSLPFATTVGDVLVFRQGVGLDDVIRFNGSTMLIYSNGSDGFTSLADTPTPPSAFYDNQITAEEVHGKINFTPTAGQPGSADFLVQYQITSSSPEPGSVVLMLLGLGFVAIAIWRRRTD